MQIILTVCQSRTFLNRLRVEQQLQRRVFISRLSAAQNHNALCICLSQCRKHKFVRSINSYLSLTGALGACPIRTGSRSNHVKVLRLSTIMTLNFGLTRFLWSLKQT